MPVPHRPQRYAAIVGSGARRRPVRLNLLTIFRRATGRRGPRTFWELDPPTGEWHLL